MTPARRRSRSSGFTLVEILVVIAIIGFVMGIVTVSLESLVPGERLNASIRNLAGNISRARAEAISRNMEFQIEYDLGERTYRIATPFRVGGGTVGFEDPIDDERREYLEQELHTGVAFQSVVIAGETYVDGKCRVRFDPLGAASDHTVILTQPAYGNAFSIEVQALTGLIRMHAGEFLRDIPQDSDFD